MGKNPNPRQRNFKVMLNPLNRFTFKAVRLAPDSLGLAYSRIIGSKGTAIGAPAKGLAR
jgi:hypothetical protein